MNKIENYAKPLSFSFTVTNVHKNLFAFLYISCQMKDLLLSMQKYQTGQLLFPIIASQIERFL